MPWVDGYTREMAEDFVARHRSAPPDEPVADAPYVVADRTGRLLGVCGLHGRLGPGRLEIGYGVDARHTRRGVATLSTAMLTECKLELPGIDAVEIHHDEANRVSGRVPAKLVFEHVATVSDEPEAPAESSGVSAEVPGRRARPSSCSTPPVQLVERAGSSLEFDCRVQIPKTCAEPGGDTCSCQAAPDSTDRGGLHLTHNDEHLAPEGHPDRRFAVVGLPPRPPTGQPLRYTETWLSLSAVKTPRSHPEKRPSNCIPANWAVRSHSAGRA